MQIPERRWGTETSVEPKPLMSMEYRAPGLGYFPMLEGKVRHLITWGPYSRNMSDILGPEREMSRQRTRDAMREGGMVDASCSMRIATTTLREPQIVEVKGDMFEGRRRDADELETQDNFIYTTEPNIALMVKPADCTVSIIYGTAPDGRKVVGLLHAGRRELDIQLARRAIEHLENLGFAPEDLFIGVAPSINADRYFIRSQDRGLLPHVQDWIQRGRLREDKGEGRIYLDTLGYLADQFTESGVQADRIQPYGIDTLQAAEQGEGFSQRYASLTQNPRNNGRFLVAAQLV